MYRTWEESAFTTPALTESTFSRVSSDHAAILHKTKRAACFGNEVNVDGTSGRNVEELEGGEGCGDQRRV